MESAHVVSTWQQHGFVKSDFYIPFSPKGFCKWFVSPIWWYNPGLPRFLGPGKPDISTLIINKFQWDHLLFSTTIQCELFQWQIWCVLPAMILARPWSQHFCKMMAAPLVKIQWNCIGAHRVFNTSFAFSCLWKESKLLMSGSRKGWENMLQKMWELIR